MTTPKKNIKRKASKAIVTQDNRFVYAKYNMNANEMKFFMWIVAQLNSQRDALFQVCEIPLNEIMQVWQWKEGIIDYSYVRNMCDSMLKKTYIEDFKLLDPKTMKEKRVYQGYTLFKSIRYEEGQSYISYQLNDSLAEYLLDLKKDFTQLKFNDIQQMKSVYSIRIYNMLICELKQNRQSLKMNLEVLQNILEVPKSFYEWFDFKRFVLEQARKDINTKSNLILLEVKTYKTGRKVTDLEFIFDYKHNDKRIQRDTEKKKSYNKALLEILKSYIGKHILVKGYGEYICDGTQWSEDGEKVFVLCRKPLAYGNKKHDRILLEVKNFKDINHLQKAKDNAEELFYLDGERVQQALEAREKYKSNKLFE